MSRGLSSLLGVVLLTGLTVAIAATVGAVVATQPADPAPVASFALSADATQQRIAVRHTGGDAVSPETLQVRVRVAGTPLVHQPPVPFFAARGFRAGPTGPFNSATAGDWTAGETATLRLASTNDPPISPGDRVRVTIATERAVVATLEATAT